MARCASLRFYHFSVTIVVLNDEKLLRRLANSICMSTADKSSSVRFGFSSELMVMVDLA